MTRGVRSSVSLVTVTWATLSASCLNGHPRRSGRARLTEVEGATEADGGMTAVPDAAADAEQQQQRLVGAASASEVGDRISS